MSDYIINLGSDASSTHFFVYKDKKYPFNMPIFKIFSLSFQQGHNDRIPEINLVEEGEEDTFNLTEAGITDFIKYCQNQIVDITQDNVLTIHKLSHKFNVPSLKKKANEFLNKNKTQYIDEYLSSVKEEQDTFSTEIEDIISNDLPKYVSDPRLLEFPIPVLRRLMTKYAQKHRDISEEMIEFHFKVLDKHGEPGSILFSGQDFGQNNINVVRRLMKDYATKFDFKFMDDVHARSIYLVEQEHRKREEGEEPSSSSSFMKQIENKLRLMEDKAEMALKKSKEEASELKMKIQQMEIESKEQKKKMSQINNEIIELKNENNRLKAELHEVREREYELKKIQNELELKLRKMDDIRSRELQKIDELENEVAEINQKVNRVDQYSGSDYPINRVSPDKRNIEEEPLIANFIDFTNLQGIIAKCGKSVKITVGGRQHMDHPVTNICVNDDTFYSNLLFEKPNSEYDTSIMFDFGLLKGVRLNSYFIRTGDLGQSKAYPKTWVIEGSNDTYMWTTLDQRQNDDSLNGKYACRSFRINSNNVDKYRYIRYRQQETWDLRNKYSVNLTYLEFYGEIY